MGVRERFEGRIRGWGVWEEIVENSSWRWSSERGDRMEVDLGSTYA